MEFLKALPLRAWVWTFFLVAGVFGVFFAMDEIQKIRSIGVVQPERPVVVESVNYRTSSDPTLAAAYKAADQMLPLMTVPSEQDWVRSIVSRVEMAVRENSSSSVRPLILELEALERFLAIECIARVHKDNAGGIRYVPMAGGSGRLMIECRMGNGNIYYPDLNSLLPVVGEGILDALKSDPEAVLGMKRSGRLRIDWTIPVF